MHSRQGNICFGTVDMEVDTLEHMVIGILARGRRDFDTGHMLVDFLAQNTLQYVFWHMVEDILTQDAC